MTSRPSRTDRLQDAVLFCILLVVALMAGAASFSHVHDWTMTNSPTGTGDWFGWANAVITELIPTAALIVITRRRRQQTRIGYPMFLLVTAIGVSLMAQLAVARPTPYGWLVSALPALAFFALSKLVFSQTRPTPATPIPAPAAIPVPAVPVIVHSDRPATPTPAPTAVPAVPVSAVTSDRPAPATPSTVDESPHTPANRPVPVAPSPTVVAAQITTARTTRPASAPPSGAGGRGTRPRPSRPAATATELAPSATDTSVTAPDAAQPTPPLASPEQLTHAQQVATDYRNQHGTPITPGQLAVRLKVTTQHATQLLTALNNTDNPTRPSVNGSPVRAIR